MSGGPFGLGGNDGTSSSAGTVGEDDGPGQTATTTPETTGASATDDGGSDAADGSTGLGGTTGDPADNCVSILLEEDFSAGGLEGSPNWDTNTSGGASVEVVGGALEISVAGESGFWTASATVPLPQHGAAALEIVQGPDPGLVWLGLVDGDREVHIDVLDGMLRATYRNPGDAAYQVLDSTAHDPNAHRFVRLTIDADTPAVRTQTSPDGRAWAEFVAHDVSMFDLANATLSIGSGLASGGALSPVAAIDDILLCSAD